jgi:hypothetical protein
MCWEQSIAGRSAAETAVAVIPLHDELRRESRDEVVRDRLVERKSRRAFARVVRGDFLREGIVGCG